LKRPPHVARHPVHVTWRVREGVPGLRGDRAFRAVRRALVAARDRLGGRIVHFSVQSNHLHLMVEATDRAALSRALKGLAVRIARGLNRVRGRAGAVFADRYHARALKTPLEVKRALAYVLGNVRKHAAQNGLPVPAGWMDARSSAAWFDGWSEHDAAERSLGLRSVRAGPADPRPVALPHTWLLRVGWRRHGLLDADVRPG
jgi:REP element-mobilizing transposase RayT